MTTLNVAARYRFGRFEIQQDERLLFDSGNPVELSPRAFDLLNALIERSGRLATKKELLDHVWPNVIVEDNALQAQISALRKTVGAQAIVTIPGRGYRWTLDVSAVDGKSTKNNLPPVSTTFIGRTREIAELSQSLSQARLLTIVGTGGCGKTRAALQTARAMLATYPNGVWFVELASVSDSALVAVRLAEVLGVSVPHGKRIEDAIVERLGAERVLIMVDNAEHLRQACAELVAELMSRTEYVSLLVTSREALGVEGERAYRMPSLALPEITSAKSLESLSRVESIQLFVERARMLQPGFSLDVHSAAVIASICRRLDGIPLAIELAVPRILSMSLEEIYRRLDRRFSLLTDESNVRLPRQRTLRALIDWSYDLLEPPEQALLCRLSVFANGCTLRAAQVVCDGDGVVPQVVVKLLESLVDKNLVVAVKGRDETRYRLLETIRQYATDRLSEVSYERVTRRNLHLAFFAALGLEAGAKFRKGDDPALLDQLEVERDNIDSALAWSLVEGNDLRAGMTLGGSVWRFWFVRGHILEGRAWMSKLLEADREAEPTASLGDILNGAGSLAMTQYDMNSAKTYLQKSIDVRHAIGDRMGAADALQHLGNVFSLTGEPMLAAKSFQDGLVVALELGDRRGASRRYGALATLNRKQGDYPNALAMFEKALKIQTELGDDGSIAPTLYGMGMCLSAQGNHFEAMNLLVQSLEIMLRFRAAMAIGYCLLQLAPSVGELGYHDHAARIWGASEKIHETRGAPIDKRDGFDAHVATIRARCVNEVVFEASWQAGRALDWDAAAVWAIEMSKNWTNDQPTGRTLRDQDS